MWRLLMSVAMAINLYAAGMTEKRALFEEQSTEIPTERQAYLLYFFSESVPYHSYASFLASVDKLNRSGHDVKTIQYLRGFGEDFKDYMFNLHAMQEQRGMFKRTVKIKLHPKRFREFNIDKVPVVAYAECGASPYQDCDIKYLMRGDTSLEHMLELMAQEDMQYEQWVHDIGEAE